MPSLDFVLLYIQRDIAKNVILTYNCVKTQLYEKEKI